MAECEAVQDFWGASAWKEVSACLLLPGRSPHIWEECWERDGSDAGLPAAGRGRGTLASTPESQGPLPPPHPQAAFGVQFLRAASPGPPASAPRSQLPPSRSSAASHFFLHLIFSRSIRAALGQVSKLSSPKGQCPQLAEWGVTSEQGGRLLRFTSHLTHGPTHQTLCHEPSP